MSSFTHESMYEPVYVIYIYISVCYIVLIYQSNILCFIYTFMNLQQETSYEIIQSSCNLKYIILPELGYYGARKYCHENSLRQNMNKHT